MSEVEKNAFLCYNELDNSGFVEVFFMKKLFIFVLAFIFAALPLASCKKQEPMLTADMDIVYIYVTA